MVSSKLPSRQQRHKKKANKKWGSHISALDFGYLQFQINSGYFGINDFSSSKQIFSLVFTKEILEKTRGF